MLRLMFLAWLVVLPAVLVFGQAARADGGSPELEKYRGECRAALTRSGVPKDQFALRMRGCVGSKLTEAARHAGENLKLVEFTPWLTHNRGPQTAKGVIYFLRGWSGGSGFDDNFVAPYFFKRLSEQGWDVIGAKFPYRPAGRLVSASLSLLGPTEQFVRRRLGELKAQGYRRIVLAGHSWGAWVALVAAPGSPADALLLSSPALYGDKLLNGEPNPDVSRNVTEFPALVDKVTVPIALLMFAGDTFAAQDRGPAAVETFKAKGTPALVIARPVGFNGHFSGWLPIFDYEYGQCLADFLDQMKSEPCRPPILTSTDFSAVFSLRQLPKGEVRKVQSVDALVGRKFVVYGVDGGTALIDYVSSSKRRVESIDQVAEEPVSAEDGLVCAAKQCSTLVSWSSHELLEFAGDVGALKAWWIER